MRVDVALNPDAIFILIAGVLLAKRPAVERDGSSSLHQLHHVPLGHLAAVGEVVEVGSPIEVVRNRLRRHLEGHRV